MFEEPTKVFPCDCMGDGIAVTKESDVDYNPSENEVAVKETKWMREFDDSPFISLSFWGFGQARHGTFTFWKRLKMAYMFVFKRKHFWEDMVTMKAEHARSFANHILYIITKGEREKKMGEPIVKDGLIPGDQWENPEDTKQLIKEGSSNPLSEGRWRSTQKTDGIRG